MSIPLCGNSLSMMGVIRAIPGAFLVWRRLIVVFSSLGVNGCIDVTGCVGGWRYSGSSSSLPSSYGFNTSSRCFANVSAFSLSLCAHLFCVGEFIHRGDLVIQVYVLI